MNKFLAIVVAVLCIGLVRADVDESDVLVGTQENFEELLAGDQPALVEFYAPWCGHCKKLVPEYARAATLLKGEVKLIKVDATVETDLASQYNIQGYPTLKFFKNGKLAGDFDGERNSESMAAWCRKRSGPAAATLADQEAVDAWTAKNTGTRVIAFVAADSAESKTFLNVAGDAAVEEFAFAMIHDETLARNFGASNMPTVVIKKGSDTITFDDEFDTEDLIAWTLKNGYPAIEELSQSVFKRASASSRPLFVGFTKAEGSSTVEQQSALYESIANDLSGKAMFSFVAHDKFPNLASQWGASGNKYPTAVFVTWSGASPKIRAFDEAEDFTAENVKTWITECLAGNCKAFRKSEEIPESNDGPVTVVVGKTFETIVLDETKDVFVEFYAPWCGHCKKLEGPWKQLGEKFENVESVVIAKSDATANGYPDTINVRGFPTLIFFPANDKSNPITYEGDRDVAGFEKFILEKASIKIDASKLGASSAEDHDEL